MLLFALFPTLLPLGASPLPLLSAPSALFSLSAEAPGSRGTNLWPALTVQSGFRAPRPRPAPSLGPRGSSRAGLRALGGRRRRRRDAAAAGCVSSVRACARAPAVRAAGGPGSARGGKVVTGRRGALAEWGLAERRRGSLSAPPPPRLGPLYRGLPAGDAEASPASEVHIRWGAGGAAEEMGQERAPTCCCGRSVDGGELGSGCVCGVVTWS